MAPRFSKTQIRVPHHRAHLFLGLLECADVSSDDASSFVFVPCRIVAVDRQRAPVASAPLSGNRLREGVPNSEHALGDISHLQLYASAAS